MGVVKDRFTLASYVTFCHEIREQPRELDFDDLGGRWVTAPSRVCEGFAGKVCATRLNQYNRGDLCAVCERKRAARELAERGMVEVRREAAAKRRVVVVDGDPDCSPCLRMYGPDRPEPLTRLPKAIPVSEMLQDAPVQAGVCCRAGVGVRCIGACARESASGVGPVCATASVGNADLQAGVAAVVAAAAPVVVSSMSDEAGRGRGEEVASGTTTEGEGKRMDVLKAKVMRRSELPPDESRACGRIGRAWLRLLAIGSDEMLAIECRDVAHAGSTVSSLQHKARRVGVVLRYQRNGSTVYAWLEGAGG